jgi:hypothetical protein
VGYFTDYFAGYFDAVAPESVGEADGVAAVDGVSDALDYQWRGQTALDANGLPAPYFVLEDKVGATTDGVAEAEGAAVVEATGAWIAEAVGESAGVADPQATGDYLTLVEAVAESAGTSEALAESDWLALAEAAGAANVEAASEATAEAAGLATGSSEALGASDAPIVTEEQPSGGYGWAKERRRRKRELEEEADRLEVVLAAEGLVEPEPIVLVRHQVRSRPETNYSRRAERAIAYAERAKTLLAYQLALKEIERQEEEDFSVLMAIALAA